MTRPITCDQVAWLGDALARYAMTMQFAAQFPRVSRAVDCARLAAILEIMDVCGLCFADERARSNAFAGLECPIQDGTP